MSWLETENLIKFQFSCTLQCASHCVAIKISQMHRIKITRFKQSRFKGYLWHFFFFIVIQWIDKVFTLNYVFHFNYFALIRSICFFHFFQQHNTTLLDIVLLPIFTLCTFQMPGTKNILIKITIERSFFIVHLLTKNETYLKSFVRCVR